MTTERDLAALLRADAARALDADLVLASTRRAIVRRSRRRRAAAGGGAVLAVAGLVLGAPAVLDTTAPQDAPRAPAATSSPTPTGVPHLHRMRRVFTDAGYDEADTAQLARIWRVEDTALVQALAGQQLTDGRELPFAPRAPEEVAAAVPPLDRPLDEVAREAYRDSGFGEAMAYRLGEAWGAGGDHGLIEVEILAGQVILDTGGFPDVEL